MEIGGIIVIWHIIKAVLVAIFCAARVVAPINGYINVTISEKATPQALKPRAKAGPCVRNTLLESIDNSFTGVCKLSSQSVQAFHHGFHQFG